jgi:predicted ATPase
MTKGWAAPEVEQAYSRARALCHQVGETPQLFWVLRGLWAFYLVRGELQTAHELMEQLLRVAEHMQEPALLIEGHWAVGDTLLWYGELTPARAHLEQGVGLYDPQRDRSHALHHGYDPGVACLVFLARVLWHLGYPDQAVKCSDAALTLAHDLSHPYSLSWALSWAAALHQLRREVQSTRERAEAASTRSTEQGIAFFAAHGMVLGGWALVQQGQATEGMAQLSQGLAAYQATGAELERSHWLALLADGYCQTGQCEEGRRVLAEALAEVQHNGIRYYEAELYRLTGTALLWQGVPDAPQAEACFHQALDIARQQQAKSLELRAATSLSRLWQHQGKRAEARELLAEVYGWFTEGFDTADLQEAKTLLETLA